MRVILSQANYYLKRVKEMLRLKKVKKIDNEVTAEFYIENTSECGHIVIDINIMDIKEYSMP